MMWNLTVERNHFPAIQDRVREAFPEFDEGAVRHASNNITNKIRQSHQDCWDVEVSREQMDDDGYYTHFEVEASGKTVYVRITVD